MQDLGRLGIWSRELRFGGEVQLFKATAGYGTGIALSLELAAADPRKKSIDQPPPDLFPGHLRLQGAAHQARAARHAPLSTVDACLLTSRCFVSSCA